MGSKHPRSFIDVLEERIRKKGASFSSFSHQEETQNRGFVAKEACYDQDPAHLAYLLGQISPHKVKPRNHSQLYRSSKPSLEPIQASRKPHVLNDKQRISLKKFSDLGQELSSDFSLQELKRAYHQLARMWHPDLCRKASKTQAHLTFISLQMAYERLLEVVGTY